MNPEKFPIEPVYNPYQALLRRPLKAHIYNPVDACASSEVATGSNTRAGTAGWIFVASAPHFEKILQTPLETR